MENNLSVEHYTLFVIGDLVFNSSSLFVTFYVSSICFASFECLQTVTLIRLNFDMNDTSAYPAKEILFIPLRTLARIDWSDLKIMSILSKDFTAPTLES